MPETLTESEIRARAFWSGTITFGLVSIPVNLFPANRSAGVALRMVDEDGTPLARRYVCENHEKATRLTWDDIVRGYALDGDEHVVVTDDELEALEPRKTRDIDLRRFVPIDQLDPMFFERGYYLTPASESTKAYRLLAAVMEQRKRAGIATFVMRGKEYLVAITAEKGILRAETMRFADEIRSPKQVGLPERSRVSKAEVTRIEREIKKHVAAKLAPKELEDRYADRLLKLVKQKERRNEDVVDAPAEEVEDDEEGSVIDLMEVLKRSLQNPPARKRAARKTARKRRTA